MPPATFRPYTPPPPPLFARDGTPAANLADAAARESVHRAADLAREFLRADPSGPVRWLGEGTILFAAAAELARRSGDTRELSRAVMLLERWFRRRADAQAPRPAPHFAPAAELEDSPC